MGESLAGRSSRIEIGKGRTFNETTTLSATEPRSRSGKLREGYNTPTHNDSNGRWQDLLLRLHSWARGPTCRSDADYCTPGRIAYPGGRENIALESNSLRKHRTGREIRRH